MSTLVYTYEDPPAEKHLQRAKRELEASGVIAYPLGDTWALGCLANRPSGIEALRRLKPEHPRTKSFSLLCASISMAAKYGHIDHIMYRKLKKAWPGPFTVIVRSAQATPRQLKDKRKVVGLRVPESLMLRSLLELLEAPLVTSTAPPRPDGSPFRMGFEIEEGLGHALNLILDLGEELTGQESSVVDISSGEAEIIREGKGDVSIFR